MTEQQSDLSEAISSLHTVIATSSRDWGQNRCDAWIWGLVCGWDADEPCDEGAMDEVSAAHGWDADRVARLRRLHGVLNAAETGRLPAAGRTPFAEPTVEISLALLRGLLGAVSTLDEAGHAAVASARAVVERSTGG